MAPPIFANPVAQVIRPPGSPLIVGSFRVTSTFADHLASGRGPGVDLGDGRCGSPVLAMKAGKISLIVPGKIGSTLSADASIVRVDHGTLEDGARYESGAAHLRIRSGLVVGQAVPEGYQLGTIDTIGATACHLHGGMKRNGVEIDWWPLLRQNQPEPEEPMSKILAITPAARAQIPAASTVYDAPSLTAPHTSTGSVARDLPAAYIVADADGKKKADGDPKEWVECSNNGARRYFEREKVTLTYPGDLCAPRIAAARAEEKAATKVAAENASVAAIRAV